MGLLGYAGEKCEKSKDYKLDKCRHDFIEKKSIEKFGCKTPFGLNSDNICTDLDKSNEAMKFYNEQYSNRFNIKECPYPCKSTKIQVGSKITSAEPMLWFKFNKFIQTRKARYTYQELEFLV